MLINYYLYGYLHFLYIIEKMMVGNVKNVIDSKEYKKIEPYQLIYTTPPSVKITRNFVDIYVEI